MTEQEALEIISRQRQFHTTSSLTWMRALMERLGNPQDRLRYIHVTGTNGKRLHLHDAGFLCWNKPDIEPVNLFLHMCSISENGCR